jgi:probable HAF family extracellular repeat protein
MKDLGTLPGYVSSQATAIDNQGRVFGIAEKSDGTRTAFVWQNGVMSEWFDPATQTVANVAIANEGTEAKNTGTWSDVAADKPNVMLTASLGTVTKSTDGMAPWGWTWSYTPENDIPTLVTVTITANDGEPDHNLSTVTFQLAVRNAPPTVIIQNAPGTVPQGTQVRLSALVSDPGTHDTFSNYQWTVTCGAQQIATGQTADFAFTPARAGEYHVSLTVDDNGPAGTNHSAPATAIVLVTNVFPQGVSAGGPYLLLEGGSLHLAAAAHEPDGSDDTIYYRWVVNDNELPATGRCSAGFAFGERI